MSEGAEDRTEAATPARLLRARSEGSAPVAREFSMFAGLVAAAFTLATSTSGAIEQLVASMANLLATAGQPLQADSLMRPLWTLVIAGVHALVPVGAASAGAIVFVNLIQTGFMPKLSALRGDFSRISPMAGLQRLFGAENAIMALKSICKILVVGGVMLWMVLTHLGQMTEVLVASPGQATQLICQTVLETAAAMLGAQGLIALADFAWTRFHFTQTMRMSRTEVKDETKDADGNPHIKARLKKLIAARSKHNLKSAMSHATVVITNPTHYAVALDYQQGQAEAPRIIAKGAGDLAARIRALAGEEGIPVVSNPPLARALFKLELESEIPAEHYKAVAEIIAYIWRLSGHVKADRARL
jgi:flagellar biosynthetic protein FlhB